MKESIRKEQKYKEKLKEGREERVSSVSMKGAKKSVINEAEKAKQEGKRELEVRESNLERV